MEYEYTDHLREYVEGKVKDFVETMGDNIPDELKVITKEHLIYNLTDFATPVLRGLEKDAIQSACYHLVTSIRWAKQNPNEGSYKRR